MTSGRNIWLAGICAASVLAAGLRLGDIVPGWVFRTLCTLALGTIWLRLGQQVWHRLRQRRRPWFLFWNYALPVLVAIPTLASLSDDVVPVDQRFLAAAATGAVLACIYRLIYLKNKNMRKKIVAGNWKMNMTPSQAVELINTLKPLVANDEVDVLLCVPAIDIIPAMEAAKGSNIMIGAENMYFEEKGAFTGEISPAMLDDAGVKYVIIGHSERREYFAETDETVNKKVLKAFEHGITPIICCGETLTQREQGVTIDFIRQQIKIAFLNVTAAQAATAVIAYEPIWAIGTGKVATTEQAQEVCKAIRECIAEIYDDATAAAIRIQYGGSVSASSAPELFAQADIDGGLVGGASLKADFGQIVNYK